MAIISSLYTGVSGLNANGTAMSIIGDNLANANTVGFKSGRASFGDIMSQNLGGGSGNMQVGRGAMLTGVSSLFTQGSFQTTDSGLDMGIDGDGFFVVEDPNGASFYSRAGQFSVDKSGYLVNPEGYRVQGYLASSTGSITGAIGDISLSASSLPPVATTSGTITANLNAGDSVPSVGPFNANNSATYNFSTGMTLYDSLGNGHMENLYFVKTAANAWDVYAPGSTAAGGLLGGLTFSAATGALTAGSPLAATFNYAGTSAVNASFNLSSTTQYGAASNIVAQNQDGYPSGSLRSVSVDQSGIMSGLFSNGMTRAVGQVALGNFQNPNGLSKFGRNLYASTLDSGQVIVGAPGTGRFGQVLSNSLELSNVDMAGEFVKMITYQRGFQANSKIITTSDEMLSELINIKR